MNKAELKACRKRKCWTQVQAAMMVEATPREWQRWEAGDREIPPRVTAMLELREIMESCTCGAADKLNKKG